MKGFVNIGNLGSPLWTQGSTRQLKTPQKKELREMSVEEIELERLRNKWDTLNYRLEQLEIDLKNAQHNKMIDIRPLMAIAEHLNQFYIEDDKHTSLTSTYSVGKDYLNTVLSIENALSEYSAKYRNMDAMLEESFIKMAEIKKKIDAHENARNEYWKNKSKLDTSKTKNGRLVTMVEENKEAYEKLHKELKKELKQAYTERYEFLDLQYRMLISRQATMFSLIHEAYQQIVSIMSENNKLPKTIRPKKQKSSKGSPKGSRKKASVEKEKVEKVQVAEVKVEGENAEQTRERRSSISDNERLDIKTSNERQASSSNDSIPPEESSTPVSATTSAEVEPVHNISETSKRRRANAKKRMAIVHENGEVLKEAFKDFNDPNNPGSNEPPQPVATTPKGYAHSEIFPVFGRPLNEVCGSAKMPSLIKELVDFLSEERNLIEEGIGRQSGSLAHIQKLKRKFDAGKRVNLNKYDIHAVMGVFKVLFRELPSSVIPEEINKQANEVIAQAKDPMITANISAEILKESINTELLQVINTLPPVNYEVFKTLVQLFNRIVQYQDKNKMSENNILTCFIPTLLCSPGMFKLCMEDYEFFFGGK